MIQRGVWLPHVRCIGPCNFWSQALAFAPSTFHSHLTQKSRLPEELFFLSYRVKAPRLKNKVALQVFQSSLKLPLKKRPWDRFLASFSQSVPVTLKTERAESTDACVWVHVSGCMHVYVNKNPHGTPELHCFTEGLCLS